LKSKNDVCCPINFLIKKHRNGFTIEFYFDKTGPIIDDELKDENEFGDFFKDLRIILENKIVKEEFLVNGIVAKTKYTYCEVQDGNKRKFFYIGGAYGLLQVFKRKEKRSHSFEAWFNLS
jgi:hypothetical protein